MSEKKPKCGAPGCDKNIHAKGYCKSHYKTFVGEVNKRAKASEAARMAKQTEQSKAAPQLTKEQLEKVFMTPCKTKDDLKNFIKFFFNIYLPDQIVSRYADSSPMDALWEMYQITALNHNPENVQELIYVAGRGSGKTLSVSLAQLFAVIHGQRDVVHVGAIQAQAKRAYDYINGYLMRDRVKGIVDPPKTPEGQKILVKNTMERSSFKVDGEICTIEIIPCTIKSTNGPHVSFVTVDEVDTISGEGLKAYKEISGMLDTKRGRKPIRVNISTRKSRYGLMEQQITSAEKMGKIVRRWTALEFTERCPDSRSGLEPTLYYVNTEDNTVLSPENWHKVHDQKKKEYEPVQALDKCVKCPLLAWCRGDAKNQASKSTMLKSIDEINAKIMSEGSDWTSAQLFNLKPSVEGIVYKEFDERTHVKNWNEMWFILTGKPFPGECNHDIFIKKAHAMGCGFYAGIDWGWSNPNTIVVFCVDSRENVYVVKSDGMTYVSRPAWMHHVKNKYHQQYRISLYFPDLADPGDAVEMKKLGLPVPSNMVKGEVMSGVNIIKKWLRVPGTSEAKLFVAKEGNKPLIEEFHLYHFKTNSAGEITEDLDTEHDHWLDALRYGFQTLFGKNTIVLSNSGLDADLSQIVDNRGHFFKPPTASEYAKAIGVDFSSEYTTDKIGKIGRLSEIDGEEDESNNDGGFIFTV